MLVLMLLLCYWFLLGNENWKWRIKKGRKGLTYGLLNCSSLILIGKTSVVSVQCSAACLYPVLHFRKQSCFQPYWNPFGGALCKQQCTLCFVWSCCEPDPVLRWDRWQSEVGNGACLVNFETLVLNGACIEWQLWQLNPPGGEDISVSGREGLSHPPKLVQAGFWWGGLRSWQGNSVSSPALQARLAENGDCAKPLCSGI